MIWSHNANKYTFPEYVKVSAMLSKLNIMLQSIRDIALIVVSLYIMGTSYGKWDIDPFHLVLFNIATAFFMLSIINLVLLLRRVGWKGYYYFNAIAQLFPAVLLTMFVQFNVWLGPPFLILNVAILVTLIERKKKQKPQL